MAGKKSSKVRVQEAIDALGLDSEVVTMPDTTRTAEDAAAACGCVVDQIVKSLIFERHDNQHLVLLLIAGSNRADMDLAAKVIGSTLDRADPKKCVLKPALPLEASRQWAISARWKSILTRICSRLRQSGQRPVRPMPCSRLHRRL